jgi:hypothetical protein
MTIAGAGELRIRRRQRRDHPLRARRMGQAL